MLFVLLFPYKASFWGRVFGAINVGITLLIPAGIIGAIHKAISVNSNKRKYDAGLSEHVAVITKKLSESLDVQYWQVLPPSIVFLYGKQGCCLVHSGRGNIVCYKKNNIKSVKMDHVHLGSTSVGNAVTTGDVDDAGRFYGETQTFATTTNQFEWRIDIYSDFEDYPNISLKLPNEKEDIAKHIYALLTT